MVISTVKRITVVSEDSEGWTYEGIRKSPSEKRPE